MRWLYQQSKLKISDIVKMYPHFAERSVYRHCKLPVDNKGEAVVDRRKRNSGRSKKLLERDERQILRTIPKLRESVGTSFTAKLVKAEAMVNHVCDRTIRRCLNRHGYKYSTKIRKGILTKADLKKKKCLPRI